MNNLRRDLKINEIKTYIRKNLERIQEDYTGCLYREYEIRQMTMQIQIFLTILKESYQIYDFWLSADTGGIYGECEVFRFFNDPDNIIKFSLDFRS